MASQIDQGRFRQIIRSIIESPDPDGIKTFTLSVPPAIFFLRVEHDFSVYYSFVKSTNELHVYEVVKTPASLAEALAWRPYD